MNSTWVGWVPNILKYIEQNQYDQLFQSNSWGLDPNLKSISISTLLCPSRAPTNTPAPLSYVVNCGAPDVRYSDLTATGISTDAQENGIFFDWFTPKWAQLTGQAKKPPVVTTDLAWISKHDGNPMTLMLSENIDALDWIRLPNGVNNDIANPMNNMNKIDGQSWWQGMTWDIPVGSSPPTAPFKSSNSPPSTMNLSTGANVTLILNRNSGLQPTYQNANITAQGLPTPLPTGEFAFARPSSNHPGGFLVTMCDAHTQFVSQDIDYRVYYLLMTPDSQATKIPGKTGAAADITPRPSGVLNADDLNK
jgi:hypothetical protein